MKLILACFLSLGTTHALLRVNHPSDGNFDEIMEDLLNSMEFHDATVVFHDSFDNHENNDQIKNIADYVTRRVPVHTFTFADLSFPREPRRFLSSRSLFVYGMAEKSAPTLADCIRLMNLINFSSFHGHQAKLLLVMVLEEDSNLQEVLSYFWLQKVLEVAILSRKREREPKGVPNQPWMVHYSDPFRNTHTSKAFVKNMELYPDRLFDLGGIPVNVAVYDAKLYSDPRSEFGRGVPSVDNLTLQTLESVMNFKAEVNDVSKEFASSMSSDTKTGFSNLFNLRYDLLMSTVAALLTMWSDYGIQKSYPYRNEELCLYIPITFEDKTDELLLKFVITIAVTISIILLFRVSSLILKFDSYCWRAIRVFSLLISVSLPVEYKKIAEKLLFLSLVMASALYSSSLYMELLQLSMNTKKEVEVSDASDIERLGYTLYYEQHSFEGTISLAEGSIRTLMERSVKINFRINCYELLLNFRNVSCMQPDSHTEAGSMEKRFDITKIMRKTHACLTTHIMQIYYLNYSLPYVGRINDILMRVEEGGIRDKWMANYRRAYQYNLNFSKPVENDDHEAFSPRMALVIIIGAGLGIATTTFFGERLFCRRKIAEEEEERETIDDFRPYAIIDLDYSSE